MEPVRLRNQGLPEVEILEVVWDEFLEHSLITVDHAAIVRGHKVIQDEAATLLLVLRNENLEEDHNPIAHDNRKFAWLCKVKLYNLKVDLAKHFNAAFGSLADYLEDLFESDLLDELDCVS